MNTKKGSAHIRPILKQSRLQKGTQKKVASDLGITETHLRELENGRSIPGTKLLVKFEIYLGVPCQKIFPDLFNPDFYLDS